MIFFKFFVHSREFLIYDNMRKIAVGIVYMLFFGPVTAWADTLNIEWLDEIIVSTSQLEEKAPVTLQTIRKDEIKYYLSGKTYP